MKKSHDRQAAYKRLHDAAAAFGTIAILALIIVDAEVPSWIHWAIALGFTFSIATTWILYRKNGGQTASRQSVIGVSLLGFCIILFAIFITCFR